MALYGSSTTSDMGTVVECRHAERCGGCPILNLTYGEQLLVKRGRVVQSVTRYPSLELIYTEPLVPAEPITEYRTRAKLIVGPGGAVGLYGRGGGHHVVDIPGCRVLSPALARAADLLRQRIALDEREGGPLAPTADGRGALRAIDLRETRTDPDAPAAVLVTLVMSRQRCPAESVLTALAEHLREAHPFIAGIAVSLHDGESPQVLGSETRVLSGDGAVLDRVGRSLHLATYGSFVQSHRGQAGNIHAMLVDALGLERSTSPKRILDLYGGSGSIAIALAAAGAKVTLVESFPPAVEQAVAAALLQGLSIEAECQDVGTSLKERFGRGEAFDCAVVNPSRRGMGPVARDGLAKLEIPTIAYVSCDPDTLARDLDHFVRLGYGTTTLRPLDMIPLTEEVETVSILRRGASPTPPVLFEDDDVLVVAKAPHEPVLPRADGAPGVSLKERAMRLPGIRSLRPVGRDDTSTSGIVFFAKSDESHDLFTRAFVAPSTRRVYVAYVRGVTPQKGTIARDLREDGRTHPARTRYRRLAIAGGHSVLRVVPEQERPHQVRRHLAAIGHPVLGDERYGHPPSNRFFEERNGLDRTFLHGVRVEIDHPRTGIRLLLESPLHGDLRSVLERTSGAGTLRFLEQKHALGSGPLSSFPPPSESESPESALELDLGAPSVRLDLTGDDDDSRGSVF